jgi:hypothetical protein
MSAYRSPADCSSHRSGSAGQGLEPVPFGTQPAHLLVELLIERRVRVQCLDPVGDLVQLVLVVGARDQAEPLDRDTERGGHDLVLRCPTAVSATAIRTMLPHPLRRLPVPVHR